MKKQKKQFFIIICILVLCVGGYFVAKSLPEGEKNTEEVGNYGMNNLSVDEYLEQAAEATTEEVTE